MIAVGVVVGYYCLAITTPGHHVLYAPCVLELPCQPDTMSVVCLRCVWNVRLLGLRCQSYIVHGVCLMFVRTALPFGHNVCGICLNMFGQRFHPGIMSGICLECVRTALSLGHNYVWICWDCVSSFTLCLGYVCSLKNLFLHFGTCLTLLSYPSRDPGR